MRPVIVAESEMEHAASKLIPLLLLAALVGCGGDKGRPSLIEEARERHEQGADEPPYTKREGLHIDIPYLMGRRYDSLDAELVTDQLGTEVGRETLEHWGVVEIEFADRTIQLYRDEIFYISYELPHPMDMTTALGVCGFSLRQAPSLSATFEERIVNYWTMRQISLMRIEAGSELFNEIRVWKLRPQEVEQGRTE